MHTMILYITKNVQGYHMKLNVGLKLWSVNTDSYYDEAIKLYNGGYFDYIELYVVPNTISTLDKWAKLDIPFIIHHAHFVQGFDLSNKDKAEQNYNTYLEAKQFADTLNAKFIIFHGGIGGDVNETIRQLKHINDSRALIENKPYIVAGEQYSGMNCIGATHEDITKIIEEVKCGFCFDFGHAVCAANALNIDVDSFIDKFIALKPDMYHLTDVTDIKSPYDSHIHLGMGEIDVVKQLSKISNDSYITFETQKNSKDSLDDFKQDIHWLRDNMKGQI